MVRGLGSTSLVNRRPLSLRDLQVRLLPKHSSSYGDVGSSTRFLTLIGAARNAQRVKVQKLLELRPKKTLATLDRMVVQIDATTYQILGATSYDAMGNQTVYMLSKPSLGKEHKESWFNFQVPKAVNVIRVNVSGTPVKP